jgi:uncharacterized membrane protein (UPF0182 family)
MEFTTKRNYLLAITAVSALFLLNALALWLGQRYDSDLHSDPTYSSYLRIRSLVLQPGTIALVVCAFAVWSAIIYRKSRRHPLSEKQKIIFVCLLLAAFYGYILTAAFKI